MAWHGGLLGIAVLLALFTACSGQSGTEKDGADIDEPCTVPDLEDPSLPDGGLDFAIGPLAEALAGDFVGELEPGGPLALDVDAGEPSLDCGGYRVPLRFHLLSVEAGVDEAFSTDALIDDPAPRIRYVVLLERASSTWRDPAMDAETDVELTHTLTFDDPDWTVQIGWRGDEPGGTLGTWRLHRD